MSGWHIKNHAETPGRMGGCPEFNQRRKRIFGVSDKYAQSAAAAAAATCMHD